MKTLARRLRRLEERFCPEPKDFFRLVIAGMEYEPGLLGARCQRTLCPNGIVDEIVRLGTSADGRALAKDELDAWVASFPIERLSTRGERT